MKDGRENTKLMEDTLSVSEQAHQQPGENANNNAGSRKFWKGDVGKSMKTGVGII